MTAFTPTEVPILGLPEICRLARDNPNYIFLSDQEYADLVEQVAAENENIGIMIDNDRWPQLRCAGVPLLAEAYMPKLEFVGRDSLVHLLPGRVG